MLLGHLDEPGTLERAGRSKLGLFLTRPEVSTRAETKGQSGMVVSMYAPLGGGPLLRLGVEAEGHVDAVLGRVHREILLRVDSSD